jgi:hypothetical protein
MDNRSDSMDNRVDDVSDAELAEWQGQKQIMSLELLQSIYRDETQSLYVRKAAAKDALPYEFPKLAVTAVITDESFAVQLDRAVARSRTAVKTIEAKPIEKPVIPPPPSTDLWKPTVPDLRRFRRRF